MIASTLGGALSGPRAGQILTHGWGGPLAGEDDRAQRAFLLYAILVALVLVPFPYVAYALVTRTDLTRALVQSAVGEAANVVLLLLLRRGHVAAAAVGQVTCFWLFFFVTAWTGTGTLSEAYQMGFPLVILLAGTLVSTEGAIVATGASLAGGLALLIAATEGLGARAPVRDQALTWVLSLCLFPVTAALQYLGGRVLRNSLARLRAAHEEIRCLNAGLERTVAERTAQLSTSNRELEAFSSAVSHDLRTPLRVINGFAHALAEDCAPGLGKAGAEYVEHIRSETMRMDELIRALLELSRITRAELKRKDVDLSDLARRIGADLARAEPEHAVELIVEPGLHADADPTLVGVVLTNLLGNAWKFTRKTPEPRVEVGRSGAAFFVRDNGAGFDMKDAPQLFKAFKRLHSSHDFPGTGIGLATVQRVVSRHGGRIWAESARGKGATFSFTLSGE